MAAKEIELTVLTNTSGPLTKKLSLDANGKLVKDASDCLMISGRAERTKVAGVARSRWWGICLGSRPSANASTITQKQPSIASSVAKNLSHDNGEHS
ncbi:hypothetical protein [Bradyrhizobium lablabi]|uniref:hypothetical protein n=1 Tax=Bradyrhizobium lablabi TaxID=722472 RepID=UPI001BA5203B|nr:hypothetical protein [Bradyrhizobium lablabi]MBR0694274.1 hypothetical protein [Bradyrhizobium lablabi]